jgi:cytochrome P450/uncharacterized protein GlcG (DUF336 family)
MRVDEHSLMDPDIQADPYAYYAALREQAPVYRMPDTGAYVISRYRDIQHVLARPEIWSIDLVGKAGSSMFQHPEALAILEREGWPRNTKLSSDPPEHRIWRSIVDVSFTASRVRASAPFVQSIVDELLEALLRAPGCEFIQAFAAPLPVRVIADRLGLPAEDVPRIKAWSDAWIEPLGYGLSKQREIEVARLGVELQHYLAAKFEEKRRSPGQDILTDLAHARTPDGRPLKDADRMGLAEHILVGGHETVTIALASGLLLLIRQPEVLLELRREPALVKTFVEELLRLESPSQGFFRYALRDAEIAGVKIPAGAMVHLRFAAANRDPEQFPDPDRLDLRRAGAGSHMAFGQGEHHCLGAPLARQELRLAFERLVQTLDALPRARPAPAHVPAGPVAAFAEGAAHRVRATPSRRREMKVSVARATLTTEAIECMLRAAADRARELDIRVHIAVMDPAAELVGFISFEGAPRLAATTARHKAFTAVNTGMSTLAWMQYVDSIPESERRIIAGIEGYIGADGGYPIYQDGLLLGGIGVSGADQARDEACARAAVEALGLTVARNAEA